MGTCVFCAKPAGFLKKSHKQCRELHIQGKEKIIYLAKKACLSDHDFEKLNSDIKKISSDNFVVWDDVKECLVFAWEEAVKKAFEDSVLSEVEERRLSDFYEYFQLSQKILDRNGAFTRVVKGAVLRELMSGNIPEKVEIKGLCPFNLQKNEKLIWVFSGVDYFEEKDRTRYVGGTHGFSVRIAKGVYYRTGAFKGERVLSTELVHVGNGLMGVTNKNIYFHSDKKSLRLPLNKVVSFVPYSDGIGLQRDAASAKPQLFMTGDGWFTYNLIVNVAQL